MLHHAGYSDPFVKGELAAKRFVTKVKWKTLSPKWNESFKLPVANWDLPNVLLLRVLDKDRFHDDELGSVTHLVLNLAEAMYFVCSFLRLLSLNFNTSIAWDLPAVQVLEKVSVSLQEVSRGMENSLFLLYFILG